MILTSNLVLFASSSVLRRLLCSLYLSSSSMSCVLEYTAVCLLRGRRGHLNVDMNERGSLGEAMPDRSSISS